MMRSGAMRTRSIEVDMTSCFFIPMFNDAMPSVYLVIARTKVMRLPQMTKNIGRECMKCSLECMKCWDNGDIYGYN